MGGSEFEVKVLRTVHLENAVGMAFSNHLTVAFVAL